MRIGFDAKRAFLNNTGLGNYSRNTISNLIEYFPENEYFLYTTSKGRREDFQSGKPNVNVVFPEAFLQYFPSVWRSYFIKNNLVKDGIRIYHGLSNELPAGIEKTNIKTLVTIHDLIFLRFPHLYPSVDRMIYKKKFRNACMVANRIIATSEQTKNDIIEFFGTDPSKISVVYQGCSDIFYETLDDAEKERVRKKYNLPGKYILNVGTIEERKNLLTLVEALNELREESIDVPLVVVGKPTTYKNEVVQYLEDEHMLNRVIFLENIPSADFPAIYQLASLFVYPSFFEGFGIPVTEALCSGVPVITSTESCLPEVGGPYSKYINPYDPADLAHAIEKVLSDSAVAREMSAKGKEFVQKFHKSQVTAELMNIYKSLI